MGDISFSIEHQGQDQWCWAAVTVSICEYYKDPSPSDQCDFVNQIFGPIRGDTDCCQEGGSDSCNMPWSLSNALSTVGHLAPPVRGVVSFDDLNEEIEVHQRPVAVRITLSDLDATHFIVVVGCEQTADGGQWVKIADPSGAAGNIASIEYSALVDRLWDESYFTT